MKRIKLLAFLIFCLIAIPNVYASNASTRITGSNSIKVGETTTLYVKVDASSTIKGVDVTYSSSGSISVISVSATGGMTEQSRNGNRILLYAPSAVSSGSSVLAIKIKGNSVGSGTVSITKLEATVSGETAVSSGAKFNVTVNPAKTQAEIEAEKKAKEEAEAKAKAEAEAKQLALDKAKVLVEAAEKSLLKDDYEAALKSVNDLEDSSEKNALSDRLVEVRVGVAVKEASKNCEVKECEEKECKTSNRWLLLNILLLLVVIGEFVYIIVSNKKENK